MGSDLPAHKLQAVGLLQSLMVAWMCYPYLDLIWWWFFTIPAAAAVLWANDFSDLPVMITRNLFWVLSLFHIQCHVSVTIRPLTYAAILISALECIWHLPDSSSFPHHQCIFWQLISGFWDFNDSCLLQDHWWKCWMKPVWHPDITVYFTTLKSDSYTFTFASYSTMRP